VIAGEAGQARTRPRRAVAGGLVAAMSWSREERHLFTDDVLDALPGPDAPDVSTNELGDRFGLDAYERSVRLWTVLDRLARKGLVERICRLQLVLPVLATHPGRPAGPAGRAHRPGRPPAVALHPRAP
jgi:hypothetical protein